MVSPSQTSANRSTAVQRFLVVTLLCLATAYGLYAQTMCPLQNDLTQPPNGSSTSETSIHFQWNPAGSGITGYDAFISKDGAAFSRPPACFSSPMPDCRVALTVGKYEWYVKQYNNECPAGTESVHSHFEIVPCTTPAPPTVLAPDTGTVVNRTGTILNWSGGSADTYDVFLEQGSGCSTTTSLNSQPLPSTASSISAGNLAFGATYSWRVRASRGSTCPAPQFSKCATFTVRSCDLPGTFSPSSPADGASLPSPVLLTWGASSGAMSYIVWTRTSAAAQFTLAGTSSTTSLNVSFLPGNSVEWFVEALNGACSTTSRHFNFTIGACNIAAAVPLAPFGTVSAGNAIVFSWSAASGAVSYRVWLAPAGGTFSPVEATTALTSTTHLTSGTYDWYVESLGSGCPSVNSATNRFIVPHATNCVTTPSTLTAPAAGASISGPVAFNWTAVAANSRYELWASVNDASSVLIGTTNATALTTDVAPGVIRWYVIAKSDGCDDVRSAPSSFSATRNTTCPTTAPLILAPQNGAEQLPTSVDFFWTNVSGAIQYRLWAGLDDAEPTVIATTTDARTKATVGQGRIRWFVEAVFSNCPSLRSGDATFRSNASTACTVPGTPTLFVPGGSPSGVPYSVRWTPLANVDHYELSESATVEFQNATTTNTSDIAVSIQHSVTTTTAFYYRVRAASNCGQGAGPFSASAFVTVSPPASMTTASASVDSIVPFGTNGSLTAPFFVAGRGTAVNFTASSNRPWLTIDPSSGTLPVAGLTLTLHEDLTQLVAGDNVAQIRIDISALSAGKPLPNDITPPPTTPVSISLVTPAASIGKNAATPSSLILPAIAHIEGSLGFQSDVRLANTGPRPLNYQLIFTPSGTDGTKVTQQTSLQVDSGTSVALDDVLKKFFGASAAGASAFGSLEVRPPSDAASNGVTFLSSRTFSIGALGTSGQFVPALALSKFVSKSADPLVASTLLIPQVSQSGAFRTNIGLVEAAAQTAHVVLSLFDSNGGKIADVPVDLQPGEHRQLDSLITSSGTYSNAAHMEVNVTSTTGKVTAYASILAEQSNDPMLVDGIVLSAMGASRYIVPGVAALPAPNGGRWHSDLRLFNASSGMQTATLTFLPLGNLSGAQNVNITLNGGEVRSLNDIVQNTFGQASSGGSVLVSTPASSRLAVTARTYFDGGAGTYGQFIPALTPQSGAGLGERPLQILQVEQSDRFRTNLGLVELTGNATTVEVTANVSELKVAPVVSVTLQGNEYRQIGSFLAQLGLPATYNGRLSVKVVTGTGRVGAYGSLIDNLSEDPTYIPAQ